MKLPQNSRVTLFGFLDKTDTGKTIISLVNSGVKFLADARWYSRRAGTGSVIEFFGSSDSIKNGFRNVLNQKLNTGERAVINGVRFRSGTGALAGGATTLSDAQIAALNFGNVGDTPLVANGTFTLNINGKDIIKDFPVSEAAHDGFGDLKPGEIELDQPIYVLDTDLIRLLITAPEGTSIEATTVVHGELIGAKIVN